MIILKKSVLAAVLACAIGLLSAQDGAIDPTFNSTDVGYGTGDGADNTIYSTTLQPDGKIIIGGNFSRYNSEVRHHISRLNADGGRDDAFNTNAGANAAINCTTLQPNGQTIIAGWFTSYNGTARNYIARLNADASLDGAFGPGSGANNYVYTTSLRPDGKILIGGIFTSYNGTARNRIARLNADGSLDATFVPGAGADNGIRSIALQPDGKVIIGGYFNNYNGTGRNCIARLNDDGSMDASFVPGTGANSVVEAIGIQPDGKIVVAGHFTTFNGVARNRIARLNADGSLDASFNPGTGANNIIWSTTLQPDGKIIIGGTFTSYNGASCDRIARLNTDGGLDASFNTFPGANGGVRSVVLQPDGRVIISGDFTNYSSTTNNFIARLNMDGSLDAAFNPASGVNGQLPNQVTSSCLQTDGKVIIGGQFTRYNGTPRGRIARLNADGSLDTSFDPGSGANGEVISICLQADGKIIIGGAFTSYNGTVRNRIARLNPDGSLDASFDPGAGANTSVDATCLRSDGKIFIGGTFTSYNGTARNRIARLNIDGSLDASFDPGTGANNAVDATSLQSDGKIIIGGSFTSYNSTVRNRIARLNPDGSLDASFDPGLGANSSVWSISVQPTGRIIIGGVFTSYNGATRNRVARLNADGSIDASFNSVSGASSYVYCTTLQPDGKIIIGGGFWSYNGTSRYSIARLNANGSLDTSFDPGSGAWSGSVHSIILQPNGKTIIGGSFTNYDVTGRNRIARVNGTAHAGIRMMLEGPYNGSTMNDALRILPSFPLTEPFTAMGYAETVYVIGATIGASVLTTTGNNAIVDWVIVEMRPVATPGTVAASRAVLLQRDGDVVDLDGVSTVGFAGLAAGNYCVAVKPRNHLPVMLSATTPVSYGAAVATLDFTLPTTLVYDNDARKNVSGVMVLAAGDVSFNETIRYTGSGNDRDPILTRVGSTTPNNAVSGYWREDVNMDGVVKYTGSANDRDIILTNVGSTTPNNTRVATLP